MGALVTRAAGCSVALLLCVLIAAAPARAAGWTDATSVGGGRAALPVLAADGLGDVAIAYQPGDAGVAAAVRPAGGVFTAPATVSALGEPPVIAANAAGAVIAGWSAEERVEFAAGNTVDGFSQTGAVPDAGATPTEVSVGIDDAGNQWLAWIDDDGNVRAFRRGTGAPVDVSSLPGIESLRMVVAPGGAVTLVWMRRIETGATMRTRIEHTTLGSSQVVLLEQATQTINSSDVLLGSEVKEPQVVAGPGSAPTVVWQREDIDDAGTPNDEDDDVTTDNVRASLDGGGAQTLGSSTGGIGIDRFHADEAGDGTAVVAWGESDGLTSVVRAAIRPAGGGFGSAESVASGGVLDVVSEPRAAVRASGQPLVLWLRGFMSGDVPVDRLDAAVRGSGGWEAAMPPGDLDVQAPALAADGEGNVVAAWTAPAGSDRQARVAAYDGAGPRLTDVVIPQTGRPGETLAFSAAATDTWSGVTGLHWSFGDGATADGAAVEHAYASAGDYDVSLTATDGERNESADESLLRVSDDGTPPPPPAPPQDTAPPVVSGLVVSPRCIAPGALRTLSATFELSEGARMLYSIRRRKDSLVRRRCPGATTRRRPGTSEDAGSRQEQVGAGPNVATIAGAKLRRGAVSKRALRGRNRVRFAQLLAGLRPGTYQLIVRATDAAGNRSVDQIVKFWVLAPRRNG